MKYFILLLAVIAIVFWPWFNIAKTLSSGDWPYLYKENILDLKWFPDAPFIWLEPYYNITSKIGSQFLSLSWEVTEKIFWFYPFLFISVFSSWIFIKFMLDKLGVKDGRDFFVFLGTLIYVANTYILMIVGGGQMGVALAYSIAPLVLVKLIQLVGHSNISDQNIRCAVIAGLIAAVQLMFDPRIFMVTVGGVFLYIVFLKISKVKIVNLGKLYIVLFISILLNLFWIIPNSGFFEVQYSAAANEANASFLSFATFSNSFSLLHPNWPENIFGKIGFMKPEFLLLPIIAYLSLFFLKKSKATPIILFFAFLGIIGAFFAKGVNEPFGEVYLALSNLPFGALFRDPTKFYLWIVIAYSILVPFSVYSFSEWIISKINPPAGGQKLQFKVQSLIIIFFVGYWLFLVHPALLGKLSGTFNPRDVPQEYINLKNFLVSEENFSYVLWFPERQRFGFYSQNHPPLSAREMILAGPIEDLADEFGKDATKKVLEEHGVKYVVVPYDSEGEIFIEDRKYENSLYDKAIMELELFPGLE